MVEAFSHVVAFRTADGLAVFDTSLEAFGHHAASELESWADAPVHTIVYTHGHVDHVGGAHAIVAAQLERGRPRPAVVGHANVPARFARYDLTAGYNELVNQRQFRGGRRPATTERVMQWPRTWVHPSVLYQDRLRVEVGRLTIDLRHDRGETDDHTWAWIPEHRALVTGDFLCWVFPNAGNPQKFQRYPAEWARALRTMAALEPELLLPAHGLPIAGRGSHRTRPRRRRHRARVTRARDVGRDERGCSAGSHHPRSEGRRRAAAAALPARRVRRARVRDPQHLALLRRLVRRQPRGLKPAPDAALAAELAELAGGARVLAQRAAALAAAGDLRLATHVVQLAGDADPDDPYVHGIRADVYRLRRETESSLMAKGIYDDAARRSEAIAREAADD